MAKLIAVPQPAAALVAKLVEVPQPAAALVAKLVAVQRPVLPTKAKLLGAWQELQKKEILSVCVSECVILVVVC